MLLLTPCPSHLLDQPSKFSSSSCYVQPTDCRPTCDQQNKKVSGPAQCGPGTSVNLLTFCLRAKGCTFGWHRRQERHAAVGRPDQLCICTSAHLQGKHPVLRPVAHVLVLSRRLLMLRAKWCCWPDPFCLKSPAKPPASRVRCSAAA